MQYHFLWILYIFKSNWKLIPACLFPRLHNCCDEWEGWDPVNWFNHTSWVVIVTTTDRPKSFRNRCVIEVLVAFLCCHVAFWIFSVGAGAFVIGLSQISSFFSLFIYLFNNARAICKICKTFQTRQEIKNGGEFHLNIASYTSFVVWETYHFSSGRVVLSDIRCLNWMIPESKTWKSLITLFFLSIKLKICILSSMPCK